MDDEVVFATPWFELVAKHPAGYRDPHYSLRTKDYVIVLATDSRGRFLLVRQYRPAVDAMTLELPAGHVEPTETPEEAARKELLEETGHVAPSFELLGNLSPDTGRLGNRLWCFFASGATPTTSPDFRPEPGIEPVLYDGSVAELLAEPDHDSALNAAVLLLAVVRGRLSLGPESR
jgi:8-oxo-dGTP pyrophosphatase MutT (NUDIX family)